MCRTTDSLPKSAPRSSPGRPSKPTTTRRRRRAARAARRARAARGPRRRRAPPTGNSYKRFTPQLTSEEFEPSRSVELESLCCPQSQGRRHRLRQHHGGARGRGRERRGRAGRRLRGSDYAGAAGESSVCVTMLRMIWLREVMNTTCHTRGINGWMCFIDPTL